MKKFLSTIAVMMASVCAAFSANAQTADDKPLLTIGCLSDLHNQQTLISGNVDDVKLRGSILTTLQTMKDKERIDMLILGGDYTSDVTIPEQNWARVRDLIHDATKAAFPVGATSFPVLYVTGNHDYEVANFDAIPKSYNAARYYDHVMKNDLGELPASEAFYEDADNGNLGTMKVLAAYHYLINGIDFVVLNCGKNYFGYAWNYRYSPESVNWVADKLEEIYSKDPDKTVFFVAHVPFSDSNSISAPGKGQYDDQLLRETLAKYPNTIFLYGHDHGTDNAYIRTHTSQRVTRYDSYGNVISAFDDTHFDGHGDFTPPTEYEPETTPEIYNTFPAEFYVTNKANGEYMAPYAKNLGTTAEENLIEISNSTTAGAFKVKVGQNPSSSGQYHLSCGGQGFSIGADNASAEIFICKVTANNNGTIIAEKVTELNNTDDFLFVGYNSSTYYACSNAVINYNTSNQRLTKVAGTLSGNVFTVSGGNELLWNFAAKPADPIVEPQPGEDEEVVIYNTDRTWEYWACSEELSGELTNYNSGPLACLFDCNPNTFYHNKWNTPTSSDPSKDKTNIPHYVAVDLKETTTIAGIEWCGAGSGKTHNWRQVTLYASDNKEDFEFEDSDYKHTAFHNWNNAHAGQGQTLTLTSDSPTDVEKVKFADGATLTGRYILVVVEKTKSDLYGCAAELGFIKVNGGSSVVEPQPVEPVTFDNPADLFIVNKASGKRLAADDLYTSLSTSDAGSLFTLTRDDQYAASNMYYHYIQIKGSSKYVSCVTDFYIADGSKTFMICKVTSKDNGLITASVAKELNNTDEYILAAPSGISYVLSNEVDGTHMKAAQGNMTMTNGWGITVAGGDELIWKFEAPAAAAPALRAPLYAAESHTSGNFYVINKATNQHLGASSSTVKLLDEGEENKCSFEVNGDGFKLGVSRDYALYLSSANQFRTAGMTSSSGKVFLAKVVSNNGTTIEAEEVTSFNTEDEYIIAGLKSGYYYALGTESFSSQYYSGLKGLSPKESYVFEYDASDNIIWRISETPTLKPSEPEPPVVEPQIPEDALYSGSYCIQNVGNEQYLAYDNTINITSVTTPVAATITSTDGVYQILMQGGDNNRYAYIGGSGWSGNTSSTNAGTKLALYEVDEVTSGTISAHKTAYFQLGKKYIITGTGSYADKAMSNERNSTNDRFVPKTVTIDGDKATVAADDNLLWTITEMPALPAAEPSFFSAFMGSMRYYNSVAASGSSVNDSRIAQALMIYVYKDHIVFQMKNYAETGNVGGVEIAEQPAAYTVVRAVSQDLGDTNSITDIVDEAPEAADDTIFDLLGRRVNRADRGLYIIGGRKVIK